MSPPASHPASLVPYLRRVRRSIGGRLSVSAHQLGGSMAVGFCEHDVYAAASVIKVPVLAALMAARDEKRLTLDETVVLREQDVVGGSGVLQEMHPGLEVTLRDLAHLMIVISDNTATNMLIDRISVPYIESFLTDNGFHSTRLQRRLYDLEARVKGKDNLITAVEVARLFADLKQRSLPPLRPESCEECLLIMRRQQHTEKLPALLPPDVKVASKPGSLDDVSHDAGLVEPPGSLPYVVAILTGGFRQARAANRAIARISRRIYDLFTIA